MLGPAGAHVRKPQRASAALRRFLALATLITGMLLLAAGTSAAQESGGKSARPGTDTMTFGLLGPVGLIAVAIGIAGMAAGVIRQRRRARTVAPASRVTDEPTRPSLTPIDSHH